MSFKRNTNGNKHSAREIVVPGELLDRGDYRAGIGTYKERNLVYSAQLGVKNVRANYMNVVPLSGRYLPRPGDLVVGTIVEIGPTNWLVDINSPYLAPIHVNEVPWHVEYGDTARYIDVKDAVLAKIHSVDEIKRIQLTLKGSGLRKLKSGRVFTISASKVPRVIGKNGSMISLIKKYTHCKLFVGQNGSIWIQGGMEDMVLAVRAIQKIEREAHKIGLTDAVERFLAYERERMHSHDTRAHRGTL